MSNTKGQNTEKEEKEMRKFLKEAKKTISHFSEKNYSSKSEMDLDIQTQKELLKKLDIKSEEALKFNKKIQNEFIDTIFDEMDELNEQLDYLRKESRRLLNEASGIEIIKDASRLATSFTKVSI